MTKTARSGEGGEQGSGEGRFADNVVHFVRLLRGAGMPVGAQAIAALDALKAAGIGRREDFYWTLHATLVTRREHKPVFDQAFALFWQKRGLVEKMMQLLLPDTKVEASPEKPEAAALRIAEALQQEQQEREQEKEKVEIDARLTVSEREILQEKDFDQMTAAEIAHATRLIRELVLPENMVRTRRYQTAARGHRIDPRATLRRTMRSGGDIIELAKRAPRFRHPPVIALVDISGSMANYSRVVLHFMHALTRARPRVHTFLFGTRLTNVTRHMAFRDPDEALERVSGAVEDWSGGTRICTCLAGFNKVWSRRVLGQGAIVLLITDGLEREAGSDLERQMERLHKSCRRLVWLNPLLRYEAFEARAAGIRAMLPHVDEFRPVHNLESMESLVESLDGRQSFGVNPRQWLKSA